MSEKDQHSEKKTIKLKGDNKNTCLTANVNESIIVAGYENGFVKFWDTTDPRSPALSLRCGQKPDSSSDPYEDVSSIICENENKNMIYASAGNRIYKLDKRQADGQFVDIFTLNEEINQITISENDKLLAAAVDDNTVTVVNLERGAVTTLKGHKNVVYTVQFRPGRPREVISGGFDCLLMQWDVTKSSVLNSNDLSGYLDQNWVMPTSFNPAYVLSCDFGSTDNPKCKSKIVMAGTENGNLHCFRCDKFLRHFRTFKAHDLGVTKVYFSQSETSNFAYTGSNDGKIKMWNVRDLFGELEIGENPEAVRVIDHGDKINHLSSVNNEYLVVCDTSGDVTLQWMNI